MTTTVHLPRCECFQSADAFGSYRSFPLFSSIESFIRFRSGKTIVFRSYGRVIYRPASRPSALPTFSATIIAVAWKAREGARM
jgi:hypothetical protein